MKAPARDAEQGCVAGFDPIEGERRDMVPATDSAPRTQARRLVVGLALLAALAEPGCARLRSFRQPEGPPAFGTVSSSLADQEAAQAAKDDLYAERVARSPKPNKPVGAQSTAETKPRATDAEARDDRPAIALQKPENLRTVAAEPPPRAVDDLPTPMPVPLEQPNTGPDLSSLLAESRAMLDGLTSYQVKMAHQERVGGNLNPIEDVVLSVRRNPRAVRLEWPAGPNKGREVLYEADGKDNLMHVRTGNALVPQMAMATDSPLAMRNSRHPITEAGYDTVLENMERVLERQKAGDASLGKIRLVGMETPEGFDHPCYRIERVTPDGETWVVDLDPATKLPGWIEAKASNGDVIEHFAFRDPSFNRDDLADAAAFNPEARWGAPKGLFQRMARTNNEGAAATESR